MFGSCLDHVWIMFGSCLDHVFLHFFGSPAFASTIPLQLARYLATSLLLADNNDMVRMIVNSVKTDMASGNEAAVGRASAGTSKNGLDMRQTRQTGPYSNERTDALSSAVHLSAPSTWLHWP